MTRVDTTPCGHEARDVAAAAPSAALVCSRVTTNDEPPPWRFEAVRRVLDKVLERFVQPGQGMGGSPNGWLWSCLDVVVQWGRRQTLQQRQHIVRSAQPKPGGRGTVSFGVGHNHGRRWSV